MRIGTGELYERHRNDPKFRAIVELLVAYMLDNQIAPDEIRDAAFVASVKYMQMRPVRELTYVFDE